MLENVEILLDLVALLVNNFKTPYTKIHMTLCMWTELGDVTGKQNSSGSNKR